jgi:hypothetical protein
VLGININSPNPNPQTPEFWQNQLDLSFVEIRFSEIIVNPGRSLPVSLEGTSTFFA